MRGVNSCLIIRHTCPQSTPSPLYWDQLALVHGSSDESVCVLSVFYPVLFSTGQESGFSTLCICSAFLHLMVLPLVVLLVGGLVISFASGGVDFAFTGELQTSCFRCIIRSFQYWIWSTLLHQLFLLPMLSRFSPLTRHHNYHNNSSMGCHAVLTGTIINLHIIVTVACQPP